MTIRQQLESATKELDRLTRHLHGRGLHPSYIYRAFPEGMIPDVMGWEPNDDMPKVQGKEFWRMRK